MARLIRTRTWLITLLRAVATLPAAPPLEIADDAALDAWLLEELERRGFTRGMPLDALGALGLAEEVRYTEYAFVNTTAHLLQMGDSFIPHGPLETEPQSRLLLAGLAVWVGDPECVERAYQLLDRELDALASPDDVRLLGQVARGLGDALVAGDLGADHPLLGHPFHQLVRYQQALRFGRTLHAVAQARNQELGGRPEARTLMRIDGLCTSALQHAISAAVALMAADGSGDPEEKRMLTSLVQAAGLAETDAAMFAAELHHPHTPAEIAATVINPHEREAVLRLLFLAAHINGVYHAPEKAFLDTLAVHFDVSPEAFTRYELEALVGYQQHAGLLDKLSFGASVRRMRSRIFERAEDFVRDNAARIWGEVRETGDLGQLLLKASQEQLTAEERQRVREQLKDLARVMPALALFALPGGSLLLPLLVRHLPFNLLPSAYLDDQVLPEERTPSMAVPAIPPPDLD